MTVVAILAGGLGTRLGGDKASVPLSGRPLVSYPVDAALAAGLATVVVAKPSTRLPALDARVPVLLEAESPHHPLVGLIAALEQFPRVLAVACDMPFLSAELLAWLAGESAPAAFELEGQPSPFPSLHVWQELVALEAGLSRRLSLRQAFMNADVKLLDASLLARFGDPRRLLTGVNTPQQLNSLTVDPIA
jgi:molybdopterin-guanine dinucleotide biosynthesis protein A